MSEMDKNELEQWYGSYREAAPKQTAPAPQKKKSKWVPWLAAFLALALTPPRRLAFRSRFR